MREARVGGVGRRGLAVVGCSLLAATALGGCSAGGGGESEASDAALRAKHAFIAAAQTIVVEPQQRT